MARLETSGHRNRKHPLGSWVFARPAAHGVASSASLELSDDDPGRSARSASSPARSVFAEWLVLKEVATGGARCLGLSLARAEDITRALRGALLHHAIDPPPAALSGHVPNGRHLERPHAAFLALPDLGPRPARGSVIAAAIVLPRDICPEDFQAILLAAARWERSGLRLLLGRQGAMQLARVREEEALGPLARGHWVGPSRRWASVTPVALDRNPGDLSAPDPGVAARAVRRAEETVASACVHIGLPRPSNVCVMRRPRFAAAPPAPAFMPFPRKRSRFKRVCVHVELRFDEPVAGPVLLGVGRYFGVGLFGPFRE